MAFQSSTGRETEIAGLEWCIDLAAEIDERFGEIPLLEIIPENFMTLFGFSIPTKLFGEIEKRQIPILLHSIGLSIATLEELNEQYLSDIKKVMDQLPTTVSFSDHLCMTGKAGNDIGQLTPVPYNQETLDCVTRKIEKIQKAFPVPFSLENITHCFMIPQQEISEPEFFNKLIERTGIGMLLDLNNIYTNGVNFGIDPFQYISEIKIEAVDAIHLAGGYLDEDNMLMDGHSSRVPAPVWDLYDHVIRKAGHPISTIVEWTANNAGNGLQPVIDDQNKAQSILDKYYPKSSISTTRSHEAEACL